LPYTIFTRIELDRDVIRTDFTSADMPRTAGLEGRGASLSARAELAPQEGESEVTLRVGISLISTAQAQQHLQNELGERSFEQVRQAAADTWHELLGRYVVEGGNASDRSLWHTLWQRLYTMPSDLGTAEVPWFHAQTRQFNDIVCLWDSVRCANSLFALVEPQFAVDLCNALIEICREMGWLPDAWIMGGSAQVQGGCSAAVLFAEALAKKIPGLDPTSALEALRQSQDRQSPNPALLGRYPGWNEHGFLSTATPNCASRSVEYAFHDHCTAQVAAAAGEHAEAERLTERAARIWESWSSDKACFAPRSESGDFVEFDPWKPARRDFWNDPHFYEGTGHDYAFTSWHLLPKLVQRHGGAEGFAAHLDQFMERCYHWKEINLHAVWLYHACGMPHRSSRALWPLMDRLLSPGRKGMADNEDMGAWTSWWITGAMGLCPVPGSDIYLIGCPRFTRVQLQRSGVQLTITTDRQAVAGDVVVAAKLNGVALQRSWLRHGEISEESKLKLTIASQPSDWGSDDLPPFGA
jgi:predicted alpha-1,2-mannosidase